MKQVRPGLACGEKLSVRVKAGYALGDHSLNLQMAAMSLLYLLFLTETVGLRPSLAGLLLDLAGFQSGGPVSETATWAIRILTTLVPACFLAVAILIARGYPLSRARHAEILTRLERRSAASSSP